MAISGSIAVLPFETPRLRYEASVGALRFLPAPQHHGRVLPATKTSSPTPTGR